MADARGGHLADQKTGPSKTRTVKKRRLRWRRRLLAEALEPRHLLATLTVNSDLDNTIVDDGLVTLREAIIAANTDATTDLGHTGSVADTIEFESTIFGLQKTIVLAGTQLTISSDLTINGPGADMLTIHGGGTSRVFAVNDGDRDTLATVSLNGMTISGGSLSGSGGGIFTRENLSISETHITGNAASSLGGGIFTNGGDLNVTSSTIEGNTASRGGGLATRTTSPGNSTLENAGQVTVLNSTISGNSATNRGGGVEVYSGFVDLLHQHHYQQLVHELARWRVHLRW